MTHSRPTRRSRVPWLPRVLTWANGLRVLGAGGFLSLLLSDGAEKPVYMIGCLALATFGLPNAIRFGRRDEGE